MKLRGLRLNLRRLRRDQIEENSAGLAGGCLWLGRWRPGHGWSRRNEFRCTVRDDGTLAPPDLVSTVNDRDERLRMVL